RPARGTFTGSGLRPAFGEGPFPGLHERPSRRRGAAHLATTGSGARLLSGRFHPEPSADRTFRRGAAHRAFLLPRERTRPEGQRSALGVLVLEPGAPRGTGDPLADSPLAAHGGRTRG